MIGYLIEKFQKKKKSDENKIMGIHEARTKREMISVLRTSVLGIIITMAFIVRKQCDIIGS